jgi:hypothetical protein
MPGATLSAILGGRVDLAELLSTLEAWKGARPGTMYPYAGDMTLRQEVRTAGDGTVHARRPGGGEGLRHHVGRGRQARAFAEPEIAFANNVDLDPDRQPPEDQRPVVRDGEDGAVRLCRQRHGARVRHRPAVRAARRVPRYDAKALWDVLRPLMDPRPGGKSLEEFTMTGRRQQGIEIAGSYPADDPKAIRHVKAAGGFALESLAGRGAHGVEPEPAVRARPGRAAPSSTSTRPTTAPLAPDPASARASAERDGRDTADAEDPRDAVRPPKRGRRGRRTKHPRPARRRR